MKLGDAGFELHAETSGNTHTSRKRGTESGTLGADSDPVDPDLALIVTAWPGLSAETRAAILAMVRRAGK